MSSFLSTNLPLALTGVEKRYGETNVLDGVSLELPHLPQTLLLVLLLVASITLLFCAMAPPITLNVDDERTLSRPWLAMGTGFALMIGATFTYHPTAIRLTEQQFWIAVSKGYDDHFEESDVLELGLAMSYVLIGFPLLTVACLLGTKCSDIFQTRGVGRFITGYALAMLPIIACTKSFMRYWYIAWSLNAG